MSVLASTAEEARQVQQAAPAHSAGAVGDLRARILDALSAVYDPELDEPITQLRFVSSIEVCAGGAARCCCGSPRRSAPRTSPS